MSGHRRTDPRPREHRPRSVHSVVRRLAMTDFTGRPARCWPTLAELRGEVPAARAGADGKIAYPDEGAAAQAARLLDGLPGVEGGHRAYRCERDSNDLGEHYHLTTSPPREPGVSPPACP